MTKSKLTDRERILSHVIAGLATTSVLCRRGDTFTEGSFDHGLGGIPYVHFARYRKPVKGDLVLGSTGFVHGAHEYSIGFYVEPLDSSMGGAVIREIGSQRLCNYSNEEFVPIVGLYRENLFEGHEYIMSQKIKAAFAKGREYWYRYGSVEFSENDGVKKVKIWVREAFGGMDRKKESQPFAIEMEWTPKTSMKAILAAMRAGGYGTRKFEYVDVTEGAK